MLNVVCVNVAHWFARHPILIMGLIATCIASLRRRRSRDEAASPCVTRGTLRRSEWRRTGGGGQGEGAKPKDRSPAHATRTRPQGDRSDRGRQEPNPEIEYTTRDQKKNMGPGGEGWGPTFPFAGTTRSGLRLRCERRRPAARKRFLLGNGATSAVCRKKKT